MVNCWDEQKTIASDVTDDEWSLVAPYLTLMRKDAPQRDHDLREVFNGVRWIAAGVFEDMVHDLRALLRLAKGKKEQPSAAIFDGRTLQSTPESGERAGYDTLGFSLAAHVTPANEQERAQVRQLAEEVQEVTQNSAEVAFVDEGYTGEQAEQATKAIGIELIVIKLSEAKKGFVLLPRRWVVERSFAWTARFRRLARDFERAPETLRGLHFLAFAILMLQSFVKTIAHIL